MSDNELSEPDNMNETNTNEANTNNLKEIINNHITNSVSLFNIQTKFNNEVINKLNTFDDKYQNYNLLSEINNKLDNYIFCNYLFIGLTIFTIGFIKIIK